MTYFRSETAATDKSPIAVHDICMCCGKPAEGPTVVYDLILPGSGAVRRALFHRDCAFAMAQRIICDAWPNRRDGELMTNTR